MSLLIVIIFLFFLIKFVLYPLLKIFMMARNAKQKFDQYFNGNNPQGQRQQQKHQQTRPARKHTKIIDPNVGEYVEFEEIAVAQTTETQTETSTKYTVESQIEDAVWEEIK